MMCYYYLDIVLLFFFFFKQKTAYEMRISDWSSDVCSSDLPAPSATPTGDAARVSRYTSLSDCKLIRERPEEAGFAESRCPGVGGYALRLIDADARQNLLVERPGGGNASIRLSELGRGGVSAPGKKGERGGDAEGEREKQ